MLEYKNNTLTYTGEEIISNDTILVLNTDLPSSVRIFGQLYLANGSTLITEFIYYVDGIFKTKLSLTEDARSYLNKSYFSLLITDTGNFAYTNRVSLNFNLEKISFDAKKSKSEELTKLYLKITELEATIEHLVKGHILENVHINNKDYIKKGMILQAIDNKGNFIAAYPFVDIVKEVNGQKATNNSINLDASMIQYNQDKTIFMITQDIIEALQSVNNSLKTQSNTIKELQDEIQSVRLNLERHLNDGIV